jgi:hypothetical protein
MASGHEDRNQKGFNETQDTPNAPQWRPAMKAGISLDGRTGIHRQPVPQWCSAAGTEIVFLRLLGRSNKHDPSMVSGHEGRNQLVELLACILDQVASMVSGREGRNHPGSSSTSGSCANCLNGVRP